MTRSNSIRACAAALFLVTAPSASAQVYYVLFKDPKTAKRYSSACVTREGQPALVGEAKSGVTLSNGTIHYQGDKGVNEFWVPNVADPAAVPYKLDGETYVAGNVKGGVVSLTGAQIAKIQILLPNQSLYGLSREYAPRRAALETALKWRDGCKAGGEEWSRAHARYLTELERTRSWCDATLFPEAAKKLEAELEKQKKTVAKEARAKRLFDALASVAPAPTPPKLVELAKELAPGTEFHVQESLHLRITHDARLPDEQVTELLQLGERMIDGFRAEFVDPWLGEDFPDRIPDERFLEFWFGPEEPKAHERFLTDWYGVSWGDHKEERIAALSGRYRRNQAPEYLDYWKIADNKDFDAIVAHQLGHVLANLHCNAGRKGDLPSWIEEGAGYWLALTYLGKNSVSCRQFEKDEYGKAASGRRIERAILMGETELYTRIALTSGTPADSLLRKPLHQMEDADLAKAWSLFAWVGKTRAKEGQVWLRALCDVFTESGPSLAQFREKSEKAFEVRDADVFKVLDDLWKKQAEAIGASGSPEEPRRK
jgi:hypothetical protein